MPVRVKPRIWPWPSRRDSQVKKAAKKSLLKMPGRSWHIGGFFLGLPDSVDSGASGPFSRSRSSYVSVWLAFSSSSVSRKASL